MSGTRALVLLVVAAGMVAAAAIDGLVGGFFLLVGLPPGLAQRLEPVAATAMAAGGFALILVALVGAFRANNRRALVGPYTDELRPFAAEFGRAVRVEGDSVHLEVIRDQQVVALRLDVGVRPGVWITSPPPARQSLAWSRPDAEAPDLAARWRDVEGTPHWRLRAELPAMARPLLSDPNLMAAVDRVFGASWTRSVTHVLGGMSIEAELPPLEELTAYLRMCVDLCFKLRRVNG